MNVHAKDGINTLTEKEKQTLRLIVRGHDAKSTARSLGLSVHTINERLRDARRKMAVSSSREAARLLLAAEGEEASPHSFGDMGIGEDLSSAPVDQGSAPMVGVGRTHRRPWIITGVFLMTLALGLLAFLTLSDPASPPPQTPAEAARSAEIVTTARQWLELVDQGRWDDSYRQFGTAFRKLNSAKVWADTSEKVRVPLGAVVSRTFLSEQEFPAPPNGYEVVKFRTSFANKPDTMETVTLEREGGNWRIVAIIIGE